VAAGAAIPTMPLHNVPKTPSAIIAASLLHRSAVHLPPAPKPVKLALADDDWLDFDDEQLAAASNSSMEPVSQVDVSVLRRLLPGGDRNAAILVGEPALGLIGGRAAGAAGNTDFDIDNDRPASKDELIRLNNPRGYLESKSREVPGLTWPTFKLEWKQDAAHPNDQALSMWVAECFCSYRNHPIKGYGEHQRKTNATSLAAKCALERYEELERSMSQQIGRAREAARLMQELPLLEDSRGVKQAPRAIPGPDTMQVSTAMLVKPEPFLPRRVIPGAGPTGLLASKKNEIIRPEAGGVAALARAAHALAAGPGASSTAAMHITTTAPKMPTMVMQRVAEQTNVEPTLFTAQVSALMLALLICCCYCDSSWCDMHRGHVWMLCCCSRLLTWRQKTILEVS